MKKDSYQQTALGRVRRLALTLAFACLAVLGYAQQRVTGTVTDVQGEPIIGASVVVEGTTVGMTTGVEGEFALNAAADAKLVVSFLGYKSVTVPVAGKTRLQITLEEDIAQLEDVVVIGFGVVKKRDLTGSVSSVKADKLVQAPTSSVVTAMQGRIAGLDVNGSTMRIRGNRSINGSNDPLVIIDGVQGGSISDLNPNDIETIDVLKDASSTAIYGSQGANGVIIVTTKTAKSGQVSVSYDGFVTLGMRSQHPDYRTGENYYEARRLAAANAGVWSSTADDQSLFSSLEAYQAYQKGQWTDYEKLLQRDVTVSHQHTVSVSGGTDKTKARFSLGYANDGTKWKKGDGSTRYTLRSSIDHMFYEWINAGVNFQLTHNRSQASPYSASSTSSVQLGSPWDEEGNIVTYPLSSTDYVNPLIDADGINLYSSESYSTNVVANAYVDIRPVKGLTFRSQFNTHLTNASSGTFVDSGHSTRISSASQSSASETKSNGTYVEWNNILTYNFTVAEDHNFGITALTAWNKSIKDDLTGAAYNQLVATNLWWRLQGGDPTTRGLSSGYTQTQNFSYAGRINYSYKGKYLFTASLRRDGASVLAAGHKWASFPSVAVAWRLSDEGFMTGTRSWLDDLKIRATYGVTGNSGISAYGTQSGVSPGSAFAFQDTPATHYAFDSTLGNIDTKWELSKTFDVGLDLTMFNGRVNLVADWYDTKTSDLLLFRTLPTSAGNDGSFGIYTNIGSTENKGFELTLTTQNIVKKNFQWSSTLTFSANKERITDLVDGTDIQLGNNIETDMLLIGRPIKSYQSYVYEGIWRTDQAAEAATYFKDAAMTQPFQPGDIRVRDLDGDNVITYGADYAYLGSTSPKWYAGFNNDFRLYNFDLNVYMYFRWGQWGDNPQSSFDPSTGGSYTNMNYWVAGTNEGGTLPALYKDRKFYEYHGYMGLSYIDRSFFKIKRISLGYTLPKSVSKKAHIEHMRVYATVTDPFHVSKSKWMDGYDPEGLARAVVFGLNLTF